MLTPFKPKSREIKKVERKGNTLFLYSDHGLLALEPKNENIVRVIYTVRDSFSEKEKPGIVMKDSYGDWDFTENDSSIELCLKNIKV